MACNIDSILEQQLKCPICQGRIKDAKFLECGHSYCMECIGALIRSKLQSNQNIMECPYCRKAMRIDSNTLKKLKSNWIANSIVEALNFARTNSPHPPSHMCDKHPKIVMKYYCEQCEIIICSECAIEDHFNHGERPQTLKAMADKVTEKIVYLIDRSNEWCMDHTQQVSIIQDIKSEGNQVLDHIRNDVLQDFELRCNQLALAKDRLLRQIDELKKSFDGTVDKLLEKERSGIAHVCQSYIMAKIKLENGEKREIISSYKEWASHLEVYLTREVEAYGDAEQKLGTMKTVYYESFCPRGEILDLGVICHRAQDQTGNVPHAECPEDDDDDL